MQQFFVFDVASRRMATKTKKHEDCLLLRITFVPLSLIACTEDLFLWQCSTFAGAHNSHTHFSHSRLLCFRLSTVRSVILFVLVELKMKENFCGLSNVAKQNEKNCEKQHWKMFVWFAVERRNILYGERYATIDDDDGNGDKRVESAVDDGKNAKETSFASTERRRTNAKRTDSSKYTNARAHACERTQKKTKRRKYLQNDSRVNVARMNAHDSTRISSLQKSTIFIQLCASLYHFYFFILFLSSSFVVDSALRKKATIQMNSKNQRMETEKTCCSKQPQLKRNEMEKYQQLNHFFDIFSGQKLNAMHKKSNREKYVQKSTQNLLGSEWNIFC